MLRKDDIEKLYLWLQGKSEIKGLRIKSPKLSNLKAWRIIYVLQEEFRVADDYVERCCKCKDLVDTQAEFFNYKKMHCDMCDKG